ncbi:Circadian clock protein kinase KaiC [uncultured archaeon]|nr:Circadian clock protein kinase KaiC [uncultured archaeon]
MNTICGWEKLLEGEIPESSVNIVTGAEGTLKSGLVFSILSNHIAEHDDHGLYITLEQNKESHLKNMSSLGIKKTDGLHIFDYQDMPAESSDREMDMMTMTREVIDYYKERYGSLTVFALDSLNALYSISEDAHLRDKMYHFFTGLRDKGLTSFLIMESSSPGLMPECHSSERFLADGTIELGIIESNGAVKRYIQILKMRSRKHAMEKHQIIIDEMGINILGPIY